jgi:hypothetical protein
MVLLDLELWLSNIKTESKHLQNHLHHDFDGFRAIAE